MKMIFLFLLSFITFINSTGQGVALQQAQYDYDTKKAIQLRQDMGKPICKDIAISMIVEEKEDLFQNAENMMLGTLPEIKDTELDQSAEIVAINGNRDLNSLFYYSKNVSGNISPSDVLLVIRHGETAKTKNINPSQSGNPITENAVELCNLLKKILLSDKSIYSTSLYSSTTLRNYQTAKAISGETKDSILGRSPDSKNQQTPPKFPQKTKEITIYDVPALKELDLGDLQENDKATVLQDENFKKAVCSLKKFPGAENTIANEILKFSVGLEKISQHKGQKMGIAVVNSAMMGVIIYHILSHAISDYDFNKNIASCIPANLDFLCLSCESDDKGGVRFRIYDNRQVQQIFRDTNLGKYLSPSDKAKASIDGTDDGILLQKINLQRYEEDKGKQIFQH